MNWFNLSDNVNALSFIGAIVILLLTIVVVGRLYALMKVKKNEAELGEEEWDGIREFKNQIPLGWSVSFVVLIGWTIWYFLAGYPLNSYSQIGEYNDDVKSYDNTYSAKYKNLSPDELIKAGEQVFLVKCSGCHGITGDGMNQKAADLHIWGSERGIYETIMKGSKGSDYPLGEMPAGLVDENSAKAIAAYVAKEISAIKITDHEELVDTGREQWATCAACHGEDGKGMEGMAPDLSKYGSSDFVIEVLSRGKEGHIGKMPKFTGTGLLNSAQEKAVGEYVIWLSRGE